MSEAGISTDLDYSKMKVADLRKELKARGLSTVGNKTELLDRLQNGVPEGTAVDEEIVNTEDSELIDEDDVLGEDGLDEELNEEVLSESPVASADVHDQPTSQKGKKSAAPVKRKLAANRSNGSASQPKKITLNRTLSVSTQLENENQDESNKSLEEKSTDPEKKIIKLSSFSVKERLELRAQKFGVPLSDAAKKEARAARFGVDSTTTPNADVLKKRAERFGTIISPILKKTELDEKIKSRQERFGVSNSAQSSADVEEKKKLRAERFKINIV